MFVSDLPKLGLLCLALTAASCLSTPSPNRMLLAELELRSAGDAILSTSPAGRIRIGEVQFPIEGFDFEDDGEAFFLIAIFDEGRQELIIRMEDDEPSRDVLYGREDELGPVQSVEFFELDDEDSVGLVGEVPEPTGELQPFAAVVNLGAGSSLFELRGTTAALNGELGSGTYYQIEYLAEQHPEVTTLLFEEVPGSLNDEINVETGRLIRAAGYTTVLPADGMIASGGVDLFCAGVRRVIEGGRVGVHSWDEPGSGIVANDLPRDHPAHLSQVRYFREMLANGEEFYFYTLSSAPASDIHWMSAEEITHWGLATDPLSVGR